jgi:hypothetical protein
MPRTQERRLLVHNKKKRVEIWLGEKNRVTQIRAEVRVQEGNDKDYRGTGMVHTKNAGKKTV